MISTIGGILLIIGAYFVFKGQIFKSVFIYTLADLCWSYLTYEKQDYIGLSFILVGMILGIGAYLKMNNGIFNKTILKTKGKNV